MEDDALDLSEYFAILWRRKIVLVVVTVLVAFVVTQLVRTTLNSDTTYLSSAEVLPGSSLVAGDNRSNTDTLIATETALVLSSATEDVAIVDIGDIGTAEGDDFFDEVTVQRVGDALVLEIWVRSDDPFEAQTKADAIATAYLSTRQDRLEVASNRSLDDLNAEVVDVEEALRLSATAVAVAEEGSSEALAAEARRDVLIAQLTDLNTRLSSLRTEAIDAGTVLRSAELGDAEESVGGARALAPLAGVLVGLIAGLVAAFVIDRLDPRLKSLSEIERLGGGILGDVSGSSSNEIVPAEVGRLASVLSIRMERSGVDRLVVAHASRKPGSLAAQVAAGLAAAGHDVGFVARPDGVSVAQIQRGLAAAGLAERGSVLAVDTSQADVRSGGLVVIDGGAEVIDPSFSGVTRESTAALIVVRPGTTRRSQLRKLVGTADQVGFPVLGSVLQRSTTLSSPRAGRGDRSSLTNSTAAADVELEKV